MSSKKPKQNRGGATTPSAQDSHEDNFEGEAAINSSTSKMIPPISISTIIPTSTSRPTFPSPSTTATLESMHTIFNPISSSPACEKCKLRWSGVHAQQQQQQQQLQRPPLPPVSSASFTTTTSSLSSMTTTTSTTTSRSHRYTKCDVSLHNTIEDCWLYAHGVVYDVTTFVKEHPGGTGSILRHAGTDSSIDFDFHSPDAMKLWTKFKIGKLVSCEVGVEGGDAGEDTNGSSGGCYIA